MHIIIVCIRLTCQELKPENVHVLYMCNMFMYVLAFVCMCVYVIMYMQISLLCSFIFKYMYTCIHVYMYMYMYMFTLCLFVQLLNCRIRFLTLDGHMLLLLQLLFTVSGRQPGVVFSSP